MIEIIEGIIAVTAGIHGYRWKAGKLKLSDEREERRIKLLNNKWGSIIFDMSMFFAILCGCMLIVLSFL